MICIKCGQLIPEKSKSVKYCSRYCSTLYLKSQYKKRNPEKVKLWKTRYLAGTPKITLFKLRATKEYFHNKCFRCAGAVDLEVHHIKPVHDGGDHGARNLMLLCKRCHGRWHRKVGNFWQVR